MEAQQQLLGLHRLPIENDRMGCPSQWSLKVYPYDWVDVRSGSESTHTSVDAFLSDLTLMQRHWGPSATYSHVRMCMQTVIGIPTAIMAPRGDLTTPICFPATSLL